MSFKFIYSTIKHNLLLETGKSCLVDIRPDLNSISGILHQFKELRRVDIERYKMVSLPIYL
jgi:hypothetical protein